ncbi:hypothetical protein KUD11_08475 [Roseovarius sp. LXJ103]|nr:hypothetical protein [Roseovarius carneus]PWE37261.1 hypothetical protein DD563_06485 [Pelagicola sp. LXJ1103]
MDQRATPRSPKAWLRTFQEDEDGAITAFTLVMIVMMLAAGGLGIDLMRQEMQRAKIQNTLDSAVLAGAGAPFGSSPKAIVEDYFAKADMSEYLNEIDDDNVGDDDVVATLNSTSVTASADMTMDTYLMKLSGVKTLSVGGASTAMMRVPKLEVALVLDVSGSMGNNNKLTNLQKAAKSFVTTIINSTDPGDAVISLVPFSWNVAPGEGIYTALNVNEVQQYSTCLRFDESDFDNAFIDPDVYMDQQIYTSVYGGFDNLNQSWRSCFTEENAEILPYSTSITELHTAIDALTADGNTSGHLGMKWGAALLDPKFDTVVDSLQTDELISATLESLPAAYTEAEVLKIVVMMGDGQNTVSYFFDESSDYRGPNSQMFRVTSQNMQFKYAYHIYRHWTTTSQSVCRWSSWECVYEASGAADSAYYILDDDGIGYYALDSQEWITNDEFDDLQDMAGYIGTERLDWEEMWGRMSPDFYGSVTGDWGPWNDYTGTEHEDGSDKNNMMSDVCTATKENGVVVYTIGFEIAKGETAETNLRNCASSVAHYYRAEGINITDAFSSIASNVVNLRLTQ